MKPRHNLFKIKLKRLMIYLYEEDKENLSLEDYFQRDEPLFHAILHTTIQEICELEELSKKYGNKKQS